MKSNRYSKSHINAKTVTQRSYTNTDLQTQSNSITAINSILYKQWKTKSNKLNYRINYTITTINQWNSAQISTSGSSTYNHIQSSLKRIDSLCLPIFKIGRTFLICPCLSNIHLNNQWISYTCEWTNTSIPQAIWAWMYYI